MGIINHRLEQNKSKLRIEAIMNTSRVSGFTLVTIGVANIHDLEILKLYIGCALNMTQDFDLGIPQSKSYLKIVHIPFLINNELIKPEFITEAMKRHELTDNFVLTGLPRVARNTKDSDSYTVWFDILYRTPKTARGQCPLLTIVSISGAGPPLSGLPRCIRVSPNVITVGGGAIPPTSVTPMFHAVPNVMECTS
jgi:hypothetical protein